MPGLTPLCCCGSPPVSRATVWAARPLANVDGANLLSDAQLRAPSTPRRAGRSAAQDPLALAEPASARSRWAPLLRRSDSRRRRRWPAPPVGSCGEQPDRSGSHRELQPSRCRKSSMTNAARRHASTMTLSDFVLPGRRPTARPTTRSPIAGPGCQPSRGFETTERSMKRDVTTDNYERRRVSVTSLERARTNPR